MTDATPQAAAEHLRHEAANLRAQATRLEALADSLESAPGPFEHPDLVGHVPGWRECER